MPIILGAAAIGLLVSADDIVAVDLTTYSGIAKSLGPLATITVVFPTDSEKRLVGGVSLSPVCSELAH